MIARPRLLLCAVALTAFVVIAASLTVYWRSGGGPEAGPIPIGNPGGVVIVPRGIHKPFGIGALEVDTPTDEPAILDRAYIIGATPGMRLIHVYTALVPRDVLPGGAWAAVNQWPPPDTKLSEVGDIPVPPHSSDSDRTAVQIMLELALDHRGSAMFKTIALDYHIGDHYYHTVFPLSVRACYPKPRGGCPEPPFVTDDDS